MLEAEYTQKVFKDVFFICIFLGSKKGGPGGGSATGSS